MKKIIAALLALLMLMSAATVVSASAAEEEAAPAAPAQDELVESALNEAEDADLAPQGDPAAQDDPTEAPTEEPTEAPTDAPMPEIPRVTSVVPANGGVKVSFTGYDGAAKYRVFTKKADGSGWKGVGDVTGLSYTHTGLTDYTEYIYTVRALDAAGKFCSGYDAEGYAYTYRPAPALNKTESVNEGLKVTWKSVKGVPGYRVYAKNGSSWKGIANVIGTSYIDENVVSGSSYTYTVRGYNAETGELLTHFVSSGVTGKFVAAPQITGITNVEGGLKVTWKASKGAVKYRLFIKRDDGTGWKTVGNTTSTSLNHTGLTTGTKYTYTVRATDADGNYISGYDKTGVEYTYLAAPTLVKAECTNDGIKVSWKSVKGAPGYRVYAKSGSSWKGIANVNGTSYTDKSVTSGNSYTYTVRAYDIAKGKVLSYYDRTGVTAKFVAVPQITGFTPVDGGVKVTWTKSAGAAKFRLFIKKDDGTGWKGIGDTTGSSLSYKGPDFGKAYTYTVRAMNSSNNYISGYNSKGWDFTLLAAPSFTEITKTDEGMSLKWKASNGASGYRLYRKEFGGDWKKVTDTAKTSYVDKKAPSNTVYTYTLKCLGEDGNPNSFHKTDNKYYYNGALANGKISVNGTTIYFNDGYVRQGFVTIDGKMYYYNANGVLMKNCVVGSAGEGYRWAGADGVIDMTARMAVTSGGYDWNILDGVAYKVTTEKDRTLHRALKLVAKHTTASMTKAQKLKAMWKHLQTAYGENNPRADVFYDASWVETYANDIFVGGTGSCFSYAAAFAYVAKAIGYKNVYACNSGGHGWTEIDGLIYDVEWAMHSFNYSYYAMSYDEPCDVPYKAALSISSSWGYVKV